MKARLSVLETQLRRLAPVVLLLLAVFQVSCGGDSEPPPDPDPAPAAPVAEVEKELLLAQGLADPIVAGGAHSCALLEGGVVKCWGANLSGQLGLGDNFERSVVNDGVPTVSLGAGRTAKALALGFAHTCALLDNDQIKCWGRNDQGQLGLGDTLTRGDEAGEMGDNLPAVNLGLGRTAKAVTAGSFHTCAILDSGEVKCWGSNFTGQLGLGDVTNRGQLLGQMGDYLPVVNLGSGRTAKSIAAGGDETPTATAHTCAILDNDQLKCWGFNGFGELGIGDSAIRGASPGQMGDALPTVNLGAGRTAKAVALGAYHTCAVLNTDRVKCWGFNGNGQLGQGDTIWRGSAPSDMGDGLLPVNLGAARTGKAVTAGVRSTCALLNTNQVKCWGRNAEGNLGQGNTTTRGDGPGEMGDALKPIDVGTGRTATSVSTADSPGDGAHVCVALDTRRAKCWGSNTTGQLGLGDFANRGDDAGEMGDALPPIDFGSRANQAVAVGTGNVCALMNNKQVKCWGINAFGQLGLGDVESRGDSLGEMGNALPSVNLGANLTAKAIAVGESHVCVILGDNRVKCWGANSWGELGIGSTIFRGDTAGEMGGNLPIVNLGTGRTAKAITVGLRHSCAILDDDSVKCWGASNAGQLGLGDTVTRGDSAAEMGNALPAVSLGSGRTAKAITALEEATCALLDNNTIKCWGDNDQGQLGLGDTQNRGDGPGEMGSALPVVNLGAGRTVKAVEGGQDYVCALLDTNQVKCWGQNFFGQLGLGDTAKRGDQPGEMGDNLPTVSLGTGRSAKSISAGHESSCAILDSNQLKCWGYNEFGTLGLGDVNPRGDGPGEMGNYLPLVPLGTEVSVLSVSAGSSSICALLSTNQIKCWGFNGNGTLGLGDTNSRGDQPGEMDESLPPVDLGPES